MPLDIPRDRAGTFDPQLIARYQRRFPGFDEKIVSMYARGMTVREIQGHLEDIYGVDASPALISRITDTVMDAVKEWQVRPLEACYPLIFFDAIRVKIRDEGFVRNKAVYIAHSPLSLEPMARHGSSSSRTAPRRSWASGSHKPKARSFGCG